MPTIDEYKQMLRDSTNAVEDFAPDTKGNIEKSRAEARRRVIDERNEQTKKISERWKQAFGLIKIENDEWQNNLKAAYIEVDNYLKDRAAYLISQLKK